MNSSASADPAAAAPSAPFAEIVVPAAPKANDLPWHEKFVERARQGNIDIAFFGDSATTCWTTTGKEIWDKELAPRHAVDFGIYGNTAQELLWRLQNGELGGYQAKALVVMIGAANLIDRKPTPGIVAAIIACVQEMRQRQPQATLFLFCTPRVAVGFLDDGFEARATAVAREIAKLDDGQTIHFIDMTDEMNNRKAEGLAQLAQTGDPHKITVIYEVWWQALQKPLLDLLDKK